MSILFDKKIWGGAIVMLFIISSAVTLIPEQSASQVPPPTNAIASIELNDTKDTQGEIIESLAFNQKIYFISDGSIEFEKGVGGKLP